MNNNKEVLLDSIEVNLFSINTFENVLVQVKKEQEVDEKMKVIVITLPYVAAQLRQDNRILMLKYT